MSRYRAVKLPCKFGKHMLHIPYGLLAETLIHGNWEIITVTTDIPLDQLLVERLAETCTRLQLDPIPRTDVIMDVIL